MKALLALVCLFFLAPLAHAGTATLSWTHPTTYVDGGAIASGDISQTRIEYGSCNGAVFGTKAGQVTKAAPATTTTITLPAGTYCFRAYTTALGQESAASVVATGTVAQSPPNPPVLATVSTVAYVPVLGNDRISYLIVGSVPLGTPCIATETSGRFNIVPRAKVTFDGPTRPTAVVALCASS